MNAVRVVVQPSGELVVLVVEQGQFHPGCEGFCFQSCVSFYLSPQGFIRKMYEGKLEQDAIEDGLHATGLE
jgi:hypothetical protein